MRKILFVTNVNPFTASFGAEQRSYVMLQAFLQNGFCVDIAYVGISIENAGQCPQNVNIVYWNNGHQWNYSKSARFYRALTICVFPSSYELEEIIDGIINTNKYEYIACRYIPTASCAGLFKYANRLLLDIDDMPDMALKAQMSSKKIHERFYLILMQYSVRRDIWHWIKCCKSCFLPNKVQADKYDCIYLPNIPLNFVDSSIFLPQNENILFIGLMNFAPNYEGVGHFINNCWKRIVDAVPESHFLIAGKGLDSKLKAEWESYPNVEVLGYVDSIKDFYNKGNIVIVPVYSGSGTNIKVVEAFAYGKAAIITRFSTKGFEEIVQNGHNAYVADNDEQIISYSIQLLTQPVIAKKMSSNALNIVKSNYSQESINSIIRSVVQ